MKPVLARVAIVVLVSAVLAAGCSTTPVGGTVVYNDGGTSAAVVFSNRDIQLIRDYFGHRRLPPGLAKRDKLPPGLQKQLVRKGHLPPGLEGKRLPKDLETQLTILTGPYMRFIVGADVVLMNTQTRVIMDILQDVSG